MGNINVGGRLHSAATGNVLAGADEILDDEKGKKQSVVNAEVDEHLATHDSALADRYTKEETYSKSETYNKTELNNLITTPNQEYVTVVATDQTSDVTDVLPASGSADTVYRVGNWDGTQYDATCYSEYAWDGTQYILLGVKSQIGEVFDISAYNSNTKYVDLAAALGNNGANVPASIRRGGMSVKFVCSSDNSYVQYKLMKNQWSTNTKDWSFCGDDVYVENPKFVKVITDKEGKIVLAIEKNGNVMFGAGVPQQIVDYVESNIAGVAGDINAIQAFLDELYKYVENQEYIEAKIDNNSKILEATKKDGTKVFTADVEIKNKLFFRGTELSSAASVDVISLIDDKNEMMEIKLDADGRIISYRDKSGVLYENAAIRTPKIQTNHLELTIEGLQKLSEDLNINGNSGSILSLHPKETFEPLLKSLSYNKNYDNGSEIGTKPFVCMFFADLHAVSAELNRLMALANYYDGYFDAIVCAGDVLHQATQSFNMWTECNAEKTLIAMGNHDMFSGMSNLVVGDTTISQWSCPMYSAKFCYDKFYKDYLQHTQFTEIVENKCYWYKDFPDKEIRLVCLDSFHWKESVAYSNNTSGHTYSDGEVTDNGEQKAWFEGVLENARINQLNVVCMQHAPYNPQLIDCNFSALDYIHCGGTTTEMFNCVDTFINNGGKFVMWLCGHNHVDTFGFAGVNHNQLQLTIDCARYGNDFYPGYNARLENTMSNDCAEVVTINTYKHLVEIHRIGCEYDRYGRHLGSIIYDYANNKIISNN